MKRQVGSSFVMALVCIPFLIFPGMVHSNGDEEMASWNRQAQINRAILEWLECEECVDGEFYRLLEFGNEAVPGLNAVLTNARGVLEQRNFEPDAPFRLHWVQAREQQRFHRLVERNPEFATNTSAEAYALREIRALLRRYIWRSSTALDAIDEGRTPPPDGKRPQFNPRQ